MIQPEQYSQYNHYHQNEVMYIESVNL